MTRSSVCLVLGACLGACTSAAEAPPLDAPDLGADAGPVAPPVVTQVFVTEGLGSGLPQLAYGDHPDIPASDDRQVIDAAKSRARVLVVFSTPVFGLAGADGELRRDRFEIRCDGVVVDDVAGEYDLRGSQQLYGDNPRTLGPGLELVPRYLPGGTTCGITFGDQVVGLSGDQICAPSDGAGADCTPGDTSAIAFDVAPMRLRANSPRDGQTDFNPFSTMVLQFDADVAPASVASIQLTGPAGRVEDLNVRVRGDDPATVTLAPPLEPDTEYTWMIPAGPEGVLDALGGQLADGFEITFRTRP